MNADTSISVILKSAGFMLPESGRESYIRKLPEPKNEEEKQVLGELQVCLEQKKEKELRVIRETLLYLHNILEDMYIEAKADVSDSRRDCNKSIPVPWKMGHGTGRKHPADAGIRDGQPFHHEKCPPAVSEEQKSK